jgi:glycosyltransferase involved in cell wall biosynthesis
VIFAGSVPHREVTELVAAADVAVVPHSNAYRSPIKLFEYMAAVRAVVAPRVEPVESVVQDGTHALLFEPLNIDALAQALIKLANDATLRVKLGAAGRKLVEEKHTWPANAQKVLERLGIE